MSGMKHLKGNCQHCGGPFDFPAEGIGETVDCPHCHKPTELRLATPEETSTLPKRQIILGIATAVILIAGVIGVLVALKRAQRMAATMNTATSPAASSGPFAQAGFDVSPVSIEKGLGGSIFHATGTVRNISAKKKFGVKIELDLRDAGNSRVGSASDYMPSLEAGAEWKFKALITNSKTTSATITSIREDQ